MEAPKVIEEECIGCEICIDICPVKVISMNNGKAIIVPENWNNCRACDLVCPVGAIK